VEFNQCPKTSGQVATFSPAAKKPCECQHALCKQQRWRSRCNNSGGRNTSGRGAGAKTEVAVASAAAEEEEEKKE